MQRSFFPFILASIAFVLIVLVRSMPLFEWSISDFTADIPPTYEVFVLPSPWLARLGESLEDDTYVFGNVLINFDKKQCNKEDLSFVVNRSPRDKLFDQMWLNNNKNISLLSLWIWIGIILSGIHILWYTVWSRQGGVLTAFALTIIAVILFGNTLEILRILAPFPFARYLGVVGCEYGTVTFNATLVKIHYQTLITLVIGLFLEIGVPVMMLYQIRKVTLDRR